MLLLGVTALAISGLTSTYVPRLVLWRQGASCVPGDAEPCPPETHHPDIDVVCVAVKPTCVTRVAIASIKQQGGNCNPLTGWPQPRKTQSLSKNCQF